MKYFSILIVLLFFFLSCGSNQEEQKELEYDRVGPITDDVELQTPDEEDSDVERRDLPEDTTTAAEE